MSSTSDQIMKSYENRILGIRNYHSLKKEFNAEDFINLDILENFLDEVDTGESDITQEGKDFLREHYGIEQLAKLLVERKNLKEQIGTYSQNELSLWLNELVPLETYTFIQKSRADFKRDKSNHLEEVSIVKEICNVCGSGPIGLAINQMSGVVFPICYECLSNWTKIEDLDLEPLSETDELANNDNTNKRTRWATHEEILKSELNNKVLETRLMTKHQILGK